eukprot:TRINITY_DN88_c0_g1_i7.p1 TRINITY_DN88_c0_g1~~TRINITY_DN88_c0_g1_i7.p1  ORF type:complete len:149 (-),score=57.43 TRINITY_DN88_c0_g1_i7:16-396(-)
MQKVVKKGVFNPREYKQKDADWAKKRKPEYMGPGTIYYEREVYENPDNQYARRDLVAEYRERLKSQSRSPEPEPEPEYYHHDVPIKQQHREPEPEPEAPAVPIPIQRNKVDLWPKRVRSDITCLYR